ncbi:hypothetical protein GIB67_013817 [Kingdonia uniflora]|uniref:Uncharacterized protein n=1 Tax=Kingdonia uniflora TaxID=39325 RepID=A0A7J7N895_9MAGN|nr:hypothetical protein GIB67_013817 [Kingdonia uniflora]
MLHEAYFMSIDNTLSKIISLKECIDDPEDFINIKLENFQNQLIQFELLLAAATFGATMFIATMFATVTGVFGMNLTPRNFAGMRDVNYVRNSNTSDSQEELPMREDVTPSLSNTTSDSQEGAVDLEDNLKLHFVSNYYLSPVFLLVKNLPVEIIHTLRKL